MRDDRGAVAAQTDMSVDNTPAPPPLRRNRSSLLLKTETGREREALRYLHAWIELYKPAYIRRNAFPSSHPMPVPAACHDTALAAFAQLAALRLGARRAFITILSSNTEYVLVEATKTMSLQSDFVTDPKDMSWLGTSSFARSDGLNDLSMDEWRKARRLREAPSEDEYFYTQGASSHWHIISDMKHTPSVAHRAFFQRAPSPRFYFAVPLRDSEGTVIGSLSILDDKPRYGVSAHDMSFCEDLGDTVALHLQSSMIRSQRQRSERLIQALGTFNSGGSSLRTWWTKQDNTTATRGGRHLNKKGNEDESNAKFDNEFGFEKQRSIPASARNNPYRKVPRSAEEGNSQAAIERARQGIISTDFVPRNTRDPSVVVSGGSTKANIPLSMDEQGTAPAAAEVERGPFQKFDLTTAVNQSYSRASKLLREALGASGVAFVDASHISTNTTAARRRSSTPSGYNTGSATGGSDTDASDGVTAGPPKICKVTGISTYMQEDNDRTSSFELSQRDLAKLIRAYPRAKVFSFMRNGDAYSGSEASGPGSSSDSEPDSTSARIETQHSRNARILRNVVGKGGSIMFYPIFDDKSERWRSALIVWTKASVTSRFFDQNEDVTYLSAFAHSLRADLARIETAASDAAKGTFISSISHELRMYHSKSSVPSSSSMTYLAVHPLVSLNALVDDLQSSVSCFTTIVRHFVDMKSLRLHQLRSPLHGILAGIEFIQDSQLTAFQEEMAQSVALAGRTLLDTVDHILDYSKISNLTRGQKRERAKVDSLRHDVTDDVHSNGLVSVDLARLTEEVVESAISAFRHSRRSQNIGLNTCHAVSVTLDIEKRDSWNTAMTPGTWVRILNNILGNALKYTPTGVVSVKLSTDDSRSKAIPGDESTYVALQVQDTGIGMSQDFLITEMWRPFRQANALSAGTGLGLSIVKEVAKDIDASIGVKSELGKGTSVTISFLANLHRAAPPTPRTPDANERRFDFSSRKTRRPFHLLDTTKGPLATKGELATRAVLESVARTASNWLRCEVSFFDGLTPCPPGTVCAVSEKDLLLLYDKDAQLVDDLMSRLAAEGSQLLIISQSVASSQPDFDFSHFPLRPLYVYQPIGPQKLLRVVTNVQDSIVTRSSSDYFSHNPQPTAPKPRMIRGDSGRLTGQIQSPGAVFEFAAGIPRNEVELSHDQIRLPATPMAAMRTPLPAISERVETFARGSLTLDLGPLGDRRGSLTQSGQTVLLVEDNDINMRLLLALMNKLDIKSECAVNGLEALQKYQAAPSRYFLVLMDMNMPIMDGFESTAKIRDHERTCGLRRVSIAALTGVTSSEARTRAKDAGVNVYVTKPIRMKDLTGMISDIRAGKSST